MKVFAVDGILNFFLLQSFAFLFAPSKKRSFLVNCVSFTNIHLRTLQLFSHMSLTPISRNSLTASSATHPTTDQAHGTKAPSGLKSPISSNPSKTENPQEVTPENTPKVDNSSQIQESRMQKLNVHPGNKI
jgi:hypothetical protein